MKRPTITLPFWSVIITCMLLGPSCSKKEDTITRGIGTRDTKFDGMFLERDQRMNPTIPEHRYIWLGTYFHRRKSNTILDPDNMRLVISEEKGRAFIKTDFLPPSHSVIGLSNTQHARLLYVEVDNEKYYFNYYDQDQSHRALNEKIKNVNVPDPTKEERNHWIIHEMPSGPNFKMVAIESAFERGYFIMNAGTLNADTRIRIMKIDNVSNATKWEIHNP